MTKIDPWSSAEITDYSHIFEKFGLKEFPSNLRKKLNHIFFERNIIVAHRDFEKVMARISAKKPFINMTGIATSGPLHLGHKVDLDLFVLFKKLGAKNFFAVCDIDAYNSREKIKTMTEAKEFAIDNLAHALALGLEEKDCYVQSQGSPKYYEFTFEIAKKITKNMYEGIYGHTDLGKMQAVLLQIADILHPQLEEYEGIMPSVTGMGLEQDPHAKITRDIARRLPYNLEVPSFIYFKHQSGLQKGKKMSSSEPDTAIFLNDKPEDIKRKLSRAFTGGKDTIEEQKKDGGEPEICKIYEIYKFHHPDSKFIQKTYKQCKAGKLMCGQDKQICIKFLQETLTKHQAKVKTKLPLAKKIVLGK
ncbi:MAG: tryptophan--tRNA ligase [Candidatus Woesearchaeota archaeon]|jgi:tryptophanyl-tRNA synthetase|nr:tryptophan--tRNA ligase [Candidatus Woesearchaeota archaeon]